MLVLRDIEELNIAETAAVLGVTSGTVKLRLLRARLRMRDILAHRLRDLRKKPFRILQGEEPMGRERSRSLAGNLELHR